MLVLLEMRDLSSASECTLQTKVRFEMKKRLSGRYRYNIVRDCKIDYYTFLINILYENEKKITQI